jgi:hypothetical protein
MRIEERRVTSLQEFYALMAQSRQVRLNIVTRYLDDATVANEDILSLEAAVETLRAIPAGASGSEVALDEDREITIDLSYEINELDKDILFLSKGEPAFEKHLRGIHPAHEEQVSQCVSVLGGLDLRNLITDRDGTVNNYCGRYLSSIQSIYNSVYISRFAKSCVTNTVILTSAPLENGGLVDITTIPTGLVINAGSKGREYRDLEFRRKTLAVDQKQQDKLDELNKRLLQILKQPQFEKFGLIGSAFQQKFGQTTMARQDVTKSVPEAESANFLKVLEDLVAELDPDSRFFRIEDTGLDVEIILTVPGDGSGEGLTDFSKGNGVGFLNDSLGLGLATGPNLVCGDTGSDVPMLEECLRHSADTRSIFVTKQDDLRQRVSALTENSMFVDEPDTLVTILNALATEK